MAVSSSRQVFSCAAVIFAIAAGLAGCARAIPDPGLNVDQSLITQSITPAPKPKLDGLLELDADTYQDAETIANAVSSVQFNGKSIAWENTSTGSGGEITSVSEQRLADGGLCRAFSALRTSYDGIRNYSGATCMNDRGTWTLTAFNPS